MPASVLLFFDISTGEIFVILFVLFLVFGPQRMPEIARKIGKTINQMKQATSELTREFNEGAKDVSQTLDKEAKDIRNEVYDTEKAIHKENKKVENELSIKTDINKRGVKKRTQNDENESRDTESEQANNKNSTQHE